MFLCYCDESGYCGRAEDQEQPVMVMAGILPNAYTYHRSDAEFRHIFEIINGQVPLDEIKGSQIYRGRGAWADIHPESRDQVIEFYLDWISQRPHQLLISAVDNSRYFGYVHNHPDDTHTVVLPYPYLFSGLHIATTVQRLNRGHEKNKGKTLLIYDEQSEFSGQLAQLLFDPPEFIDDYVAFDEKSEKSRLSQVVDTAFFVKSHHSSMAQVADIVSFLVCLHLRLQFYGMPEAYDGEKLKIASWVGRIGHRFASVPSMYPKTSRPFLDFIRAVKATGIRD